MHDEGSCLRKGSAAIILLLDVFFIAKILLAILRDPPHRKGGIRLGRLQNQDVAGLHWNALGHRQCAQ